LIILFYEDSDYSLAVKEFLDAYYPDPNSFSDSPETLLLQSQKRIEGRCGYLRQSFPIMIKDY